MKSKYSRDLEDYAIEERKNSNKLEHMSVLEKSRHAEGNRWNRSSGHVSFSSSEVYEIPEESDLQETPDL